jgi:type I restriction enzyme, S subunit
MSRYKQHSNDFIETEIGRIPGDWDLSKLSNIAQVIVSNVDKKFEGNESPVFLCNYLDVYQNEYITSNLKFMHGSASEAEIDKFSLRCGDVLITKDSETAEDIVSAAVVADAIPNLICGYHLAILRPDKERIDSFYLAKTLQHDRVHNQFVTKANGVTRYGLTLSGINSAAIPVPPLVEQFEISQILSTWDRAIERVQRLIEAKQQQKKGLMQGLHTGKLRFPEFGEPIEELENIPNGWKAVEFHNSATRSKKKIDPVTNDFNFRCVELEHISQETGKIIGETESKQQTSSKNYFRPGNVLFGKLRPYLHKFAFCDFEGVCSSEIWVLQNKSICTSRYLFYLIQTDTFLSASIQTTGTKMPRSDWNVVKKAKFALPNLEEQERITALLDQVELNIELLERYVMQLKQQKKGLMQKLLTGEIRVKVD